MLLLEPAGRPGTYGRRELAAVPALAFGEAASPDDERGVLAGCVRRALAAAGEDPQRLWAVVTAGVTVWNAYKTDKSSKALEYHKNILAKDLEGRKKVLTEEMDNHKNDLAKDLEAYKDTLTETQAERAARRDYQYEARKRLYQQYEPLLFQLVEHCESAKERIYSLARSAKEGDLEKVGWLSKWDEYYLYSTIYFLLSPLVIFKLMQQC